MKMKIHSIGSRLFLAFALALAVVFCGDVFTFMELRKTEQIAQLVTTSIVPKRQIWNDIKALSNQHFVLSKQQLQTNDFRELARIKTAIKETELSLFVEQVSLSSLGLTNRESDDYDAFQNHMQTYLMEAATALNKLNSGQYKIAYSRFDKTAKTSLKRALAKIESSIETINREHAQANLAHRASINQSKRMMVISFILLFLTFIALLRWITIRISNPLLNLSSTLRCLTEGNYLTRIPDFPDRKDEIGVITNAAKAYQEVAQRRLELSKVVEREAKRLDAVLSNMPVGLCIFDQNFRIILKNQSFNELYELDQADDQANQKYCELIGATIRKNLDGASEEMSCHDLITKVRSNQSFAHTWRLDNGRAISVTIQKTSEGWVSIHKDITERLNAEAKVLHMAHHDSLTGLFNRNLFADTLENVIRRAKDGEAASVMVLDLDRFKSINDTLGHKAGDELLQQVAIRLQEVCSPGDLVFRLGGDEFAIIHHSNDIHASSRTLAEAILAILEENFILEGQTVSAAASIGIAIAPDHCETTDGIYKAADIALYHAKNMGRKCFAMFTTKLEEDIRAKESLEKYMLEAFNKSEFQMQYQPIIDTDSGEVRSFEALMRWNPMDDTAVSPALFIPLAEENGFINTLGEWALEEALKTAANWPDDIRVAVNLSPVQLNDETLYDTVSNLLNKYQVEPQRLELEITETVLLDDNAANIKLLERLHDLGVRIALDDFGTGYSSLSYLRMLPFDKIKVDRSFIKAMGNDNNSLAIVRAIVGLSRELGIDCTAEGVEDKKRLKAIESEGFSEVQGFVFSKAMHADALMDFLEMTEYRGRIAS